MHTTRLLAFSRFIVLLLGWVSAALSSRAQTPNNLPPHWQWQSPQPQGFDLLDLQVFNDTTVLAVGNGGTVVKTANAGRTWQVNTAGTINYLEAVGFGTEQVGWAGHYSDPAAVRKTLDGGLTWTLQNLGTTPYAASIRAIQALSATECYVLHYVGFTGSTELSYTADGGQTWTLRSRLISGDPKQMQFVSATVGFLTGGRGVLLKTTDGGRTWQSVAPVASPTYTSLSFVDANNGWVLRSTGQVYRTQNGGQTWQAQSVPIPTGRVVFADLLHGIAIGSIIYSTSDGGQTWSFASVPSVYTATAIRLQPSGAGWLVGQKGEWWRTADYGATWQPADRRPAGNAQQAQFLDPTHGWVIKDRTTLARTDDRGTTWQAIDLSTKTPTAPLDWSQGLVQAMHFVDRDTGFVAVLDYGPGSIPRLFSLATHNGGQTWAVTQQPSLNLSAGQASIYLVGDLKFQSAQRGLLVGQRGLLRRTTDGGQTWTTPVVPPSIGRRRTLGTVAWVDAQTVYVLGDSLSLLRSIDAGASFQLMPGLAAFKASLSQPRGWDFNRHGIAFVTPSVWVAGFGDEIVRTTDGGATWAFATVPPDQSVVRNNYLGFSFSNAREGWALGYDNIAATTDGGQTWTRTAIFSPYSYAVNNAGVRLDRYNGWVASGNGNLIHYSEKFLTTAPLPQTTLCLDDALNVAFAREGTFDATEQAVRVELSNARGRFRPGETHLLGQGSTSPVSVTLPAGLAPSALYRIRVIRADSSVLGADNGQDLRLIAPPLTPALATLPGSVLQATLPAASPAATSYEWELGGTPIAGATGPQLTARTAGTYRVRACSATCCGPWSASSTVVLSVTAATAQALHLYPNPARTMLWLERPAGAAPATVQLLDVTGRVVWRGAVGAGPAAVPVQQVPAGLYLLRLQTPTGPPQVVRVAVEH
ncbi:YCF48-related protein [Hymenobacter negativus]|uniref:T9SS type A sorting domain-containing protein n=1 Tax=Hymenobacter negativus TaxID=2795026 RepID=A0ABS3QNZ6_9BACT|nr:YCF48-related protein [Hymenobacter negativus]MBO2012832.1 T9SS type A sorting domain-containing protein [Hymenobacter negativus]